MVRVILYELQLSDRRPDGSKYPPCYILPRDPAGMIQFGKWHHRFESATPVDRCGFDVGAGWNPARCGEPEPCPKHGDYKCVVCGERATDACSFAGSQFVCGAPLCGRHHHSH